MMSLTTSKWAARLLDRRPQRASGFTLIELIIVIVIIAILVAIAIPQYRNFTQQGKDNTVMSDVKVTVTAVKANAQVAGSSGECAQTSATLLPQFIKSANPDMSARIFTTAGFMGFNPSTTTGKVIWVYSDGYCTWSVAGRSDSGSVISYGEQLTAGTPGVTSAQYTYSRSGYSQ